MKKLILLLIVMIAAGSCSRQQDNSKAAEAMDTQETVLVDSAAVITDAAVTLVELGSSTCIPCKMMKGILAELKEKYTDQINIVSHDIKTEKGKPFAGKYKVRLIPTQVFLDSAGKEFHRHEGFYALKEIEEIIGQKGISQ